MPVQLSGAWPGPVVLRRGWARAQARPWNQAVPDAHLRLVRGGPGFLRQASVRLGALGVRRVLSPPLPETAQRVWRRAGFTDHMPLRLMRLDLYGPVADPPSTVMILDPPQWPRLLEIDAAAFGAELALDGHGMQEALESTPRAVLMSTPVEGVVAGYAVTGIAGSLGYLQRVAVDPAYRGCGLGRSLTRAAARWARARGAAGLLLNTRPENTAALSLYYSEGFVLLTERAAVLGFDLGRAAA